MADLPRSALRVQRALDELGVSCEILHLPETARTASDAAQACGCEVGQIVKSLIFKGRATDRPYLLLVSGKNRVNEAVFADLEHDDSTPVHILS